MSCAGCPALSLEPRNNRMPKIKAKDFRVRTGQKIALKNWPTDGEPFYTSKSDYRKLLGEQTEALSDLQSLLYADNRYSLLLIFQGMDASGKDGAIKAVMSGVNPQGCEVFSFKTPSSEELAHDFLWRETVRLPRSGTSCPQTTSKALGSSSRRSSSIRCAG